jgi:hypothetical protein
MRVNLEVDLISKVVVVPYVSNPGSSNMMGLSRLVSHPGRLYGSLPVVFVIVVHGVRLTW